ncbi:bis(5'-nucleosyl)-tetraphosphatase [Coccidioides immitis RS]|uniref:Bis(5'-nucleosyl)-tetraphosphatase n=2 Tax=Coccidioides immitis TaxID=5501 RepID=J3KKT2_COCIM|nr:bis(5'-nucleosyl)-tetraphosphatase [Coccidioides immitis RS]EAS36815.3 bis(5'-nucleosyl)-tetraphosphatase [Coccidioides immitis RS]
MWPLQREWNSKELLGLPECLVSLVTKTFRAATQSGDVLFSRTDLTTLRLSGIPFQLRFCPALAKKSSSRQSVKSDEMPTSTDPFENPPRELLVAEIPPSSPSHILVLNKFPVIPNHFILATKAFKPQAHLLEKDDLEVAFSCLASWETSQTEETPRRLFAFFNSGEHSGASQPHRHIQFLPIEDMVQTDDSLNWMPLIDQVMQGPPSGDYNHPVMLDLPFVCYWLPIPSEPSANELHRIYVSLYAKAIYAINEFINSSSGATEEAALTAYGPSAISYNLAMTTTAMAICPRQSEHARIPLDPKFTTNIPDEGVIKLNGTLLAGTLMVKSEYEWTALRDEPSHLEQILTAIAIPRKATAFS